MKTKNFTKDYLLFVIKFLTQKIRENNHIIRTCDILIEKEKPKLNNTTKSHYTLWRLRYTRMKSIATKRTYQKELKEYQKLFSNKF